MMRSIDENYSLRGARIMIVEDELLIALDMESAFRDAGAEIVGPFTTVAAALDAAESEPVSLAVLDVRLGRGTTEKVSDRLAQRGIPFLFYSGQALPPGMREKCSRAVFVDKPATQEELVGAAARALAA